MSGNVSTISDWFEYDATITHWCAGITDEKKNNKPKETQTDMTRWFNPTTLDAETGVLTCTACGASPKDGEVKTSIELHNTGAE